MKKQFIFLVLAMITISSCSLLNPEEKEDLTPKEVRQWALSASASDAYGGALGENRDDQSPYAATGEPDSLNCEDSNKAWTISKEDDGFHWIELTYYNPVYVSRVRVLESFNPGSIIKIELKNESEYVTLWEGSYKTRDCPYILEKSYSFFENNISMEMTSFMTDTLKITLNTDVEGWNEIDAVELIGYTNRWYFFNNTLTIEE